tara:strand:- start:958 stop:1884 length:927 start_codon:yes stop_codon:yes gene_type:complete
MFSVLFPGQGSQSVGMIKDIYNNFDYIKDLFSEADEILKLPISKIIFDGPSDLLNDTENTQPAIFLVSYAIYNLILKETEFKINDAKFFAGHSLGEYSALTCSNAINFKDTIKLLKIRGKAMQTAIPKNEGGMVAVLGENIDKIQDILNNKNKFNCYLANDNSNGQVVISGKIKDIDEFILELKKLNIKNIKLPVSAPFHCILMKPATDIMRNEILNTKFSKPSNLIISNVNANPCDEPEIIKKLLVDQIEKPVRWRESVLNMINSGCKKFIEIGPGKVLSGLVKRIDRNLKVIQVNSKEDLKNLENL